MASAVLKRASLYFFTVAILFTGHRLYSQAITLPSEPVSCIQAMDKLFADGQNQLAISAFQQFRSHFEGNFSPTAQTHCVALFQSMARRGHKMPEYYRLLLVLNSTFSSDFPGNNSREKLIAGLVQVIESQPKDKCIQAFSTLNAFLTKRILYADKVNKLYAFGGTFDFDFFANDQDFFAKSEGQSKKTIESPELFEEWEKQPKDEWDDPNLIIKPGEQLRLIEIPKIKGLIIRILKADLAMVSPSDSFMIWQTSGAVDLLAERFVGNDGTVGWAIADLPEAKAQLAEYTFQLAAPYLKAENVQLDYPKMLNEKIKGVFEFKGQNRAKGEKSSYPRFKSFENKVSIKNMATGLEYLGGFSLIANRIFSSSLYHNVSTLFVNRGKTNSFKAVGSKIEFTDSLITADQIIFTSYLNQDSIYHPAVKMEYNIDNKVVHLNKVDRGGFRNSLYSNTYHEVDIKADAMRWELNSGKMDFYIVAGKTEVPAVFQSFNYYNQAHLRELSTVAGFNPLIFLGNYLSKKGSNRFNLAEIEKKIQKTPQQIRNGILISTQMGFVDYEPNSDSYSLSRKGIHYFNSAIGKEDFDDLVFSSYAKEGQQNATINRNSNVLEIAGTREFKLSDSLGIRFLPRDNSMKMEGSKSFKFNGQIVVKNYNFYGDFEVDYEKFMVNLLRIDSITFTPTGIYKKKGLAVMGGEVLYGKTGTLYLNAPDNKSGRKYLPEYPKLVIPDGALVKFDDPRRRTFTYPENVFFKIDAINHDSLNIANMAYKGIFSSGGIIKDLSETLVVMPDTTLGFSHIAKAPYSLYQSESSFKFDEALRLSSGGLVAKGSFLHLSTTTTATKSTFGAETLVMSGAEAKIAEKTLAQEVYFPEVKIGNYSAIWKPSVDSLMITSTENFSFYKASTALKGQLVVRKSGLFGLGTLERQDSEADSDVIKFIKTGFLAQRATFKIKSDQGKPILEGKNVRLDFNIDKAVAKISPEAENFNSSGNAEITFPYAAYKTTIDNALWDINKKKVSMQGNIENSVFTSTAATQYGLSFHGEAADYDIAANTLNISGVPEIKTVDAAVIPFEGKVGVRSEKLLPFTNASVIADTLNRYHNLTKANITINSKLSYAGDASYQFINASSDTFNIKMGSFEFAEISPEGQILSSKKSEKLASIARAKVEARDSLFLSPKMLYAGSITMLAPFKNLNLNGQVSPILPKYPILTRNWINYSGSKSEEILIQVDENLKDGGKPLFAGLHFNSSAGAEAIYPTFLSAKRREEDLNIFLARGLFKRDEANKRFVIEPKDGSTGNSYALYDDDGLITLNGRFNFLRPSIAENMEAVGSAIITLDTLSCSFNTLIKYNFPLPLPLQSQIGKNIVKENLDKGNVDPAIAFEEPEFLAKLAQFVGTKEAEEYKNQSYKGHVPLFRFSPKFLSSLVFSDLNLKWNPLFNTYHSTGALGVSNIGETDINAKIPGYFEITKNSGKGDEISFFLEVSADTWYYFAYKDEQLGIASCDFEFNKMLTAKDRPSTKGLELIHADMAEAMRFRKRFLMSYLGVSAEEFEKPDSPSTAVPGKISPVTIPMSKDPAQQKKKEADSQDGF